MTEKPPVRFPPIADIGHRMGPGGTGRNNRVGDRSGLDVPEGAGERPDGTQNSRETAGLMRVGLTVEPRERSRQFRVAICRKAMGSRPAPEGDP